MSTSQVVKEIVRTTFTNLSNTNTLPTPNEYAKEFYKIAKEKNLHMKEFDSLDTIVQLINHSLLPTLSKNESEALVNLVLDLKNEPEKIFDKNIQTKIKTFAKNKTEFDTKEMELKAKKIAIFVSTIESLINDVVGINAHNVQNINSIIKEIYDIEDIDSLDLGGIQDKFADVSQSLKSSLEQTNSKLEKEQESISSLKLEIELLRKELEDAKKENEIDHLTQVFTRRVFDKQLALFEKNFERSHRNFAAVFLDIDFFKKVNDTYGHDAGDFILSTFAKVISTATRENDIIARYGGEEFVVLVTYFSKEELKTYISRIKAIIQKYSFNYKGTPINITFSGGVCFREDVEDVDTCVTQADKLLYKAKNNGRDQICFTHFCI